MKRLEKLYEGKAKIIYRTDDPALYIQYFKDDASAFDGKKKGTIESKGIFNNKISSRIFEFLREKGVESHYVRRLGDREMLVRRVEIIPVEIVVRNMVAGSLARRMGLEEGAPLPETLVEYYYKSDELGDPMLNAEHIRIFGLAAPEELQAMVATARTVNEHLKRFFDERGIILVDYKLEFGRCDGKVLLADEITPDGCRLWDKKTLKKLDKDRFRRDLGDIEDAYREVLDKVLG
ncbi:MAG TPA: phosphoribosylaminoimidazolesuccinocarboxamide synthase [Deltaproteobacteria bacterium]|nr:phosphoribosylaminoimidazolesuccinocarboxamide synthase [Deltaproteobacteria bacterium]